MAYMIAIGQLEPDTDPDAESEFQVQRVTLPDAPALPNDDANQYTNMRQPTYAAWDAFCRAVGLYTYFFDPQQGLLAAYPSIRTLTERDYRIVADALGRYQTALPDQTPETDGDLARLVWLVWWIRWALDTCPQPAIEIR